MTQAIRGLWHSLRVVATAWATAVISIPGLGDSITRTPSIPGSCAAAESADAKCSGMPFSEMSIRSVSEACGNSVDCSFLMLSWPSRPSSRPRSSPRSAASTPGPPPLVMTANLLPTGWYRAARHCTAENNSLNERMRTAPPRRIAASNTASRPTKAPECVMAAWLPPLLRPALRTTTGLLLAAARSALMNWRALGMPSRYTTMLWVCGSLARKSRACAKPTALCGPSEMTVEKPTLLGWAQSMIEEVSAPDWETSAKVPRPVRGPTMLAFRPRCGRWKPRPLGPSIHILWARATLCNCCACSALMLLAMTSAALQLMRPASSNAVAIFSGGNATMARSAPVLTKSARRPSVVSISRKVIRPV